MVRIKGPLFSEKASGSVTPCMTFSFRKNSGQQVRFQRKQKDVISASRTIQRNRYALLKNMWNCLPFSEKEVYNERAKGTTLNGYNLFFKKNQIVIQDSLYIYAGGDTNQKVYKYLKSNMSFVAESPSYGGSINTMVQDSLYIYIGGTTTQKVRKYLKSNMSFVAESPSYGGVIRTVIQDSLYIYAGGQTTQRVRKYLKSNMSFVSQGSVYVGGILSVQSVTFLDT